MKDKNTGTKVLVIGKWGSKIYSLTYVSQKYKISEGNIINAILTGASIKGLYFDYALENQTNDENFNFNTV